VDTSSRVSDSLDLSSAFKETLTLMTKRTALGLLLSVVLIGAAAPDYTQYAESTAVDGKLPVDLRGVWFVVAQPRVTKDGKSKTLPQLIRASQQGLDLTLHVMDVRLPKGIVEAVRAANDKLEPWTPSDDDLAMLRQQWSKLPLATNKDPKAGDVAYSWVRFQLATPERYADTFPNQDAPLRDLLADSGFALQVDESYRPLPLPPGSNIGQLMMRKTIYGVRSASDTRLEGKLVTGFIAATPLAPIPYNFGGSFTMYRLASSAGTKNAPKPASRPPSPAPPRRRARR